MSKQVMQQEVLARFIQASMKELKLIRLTKGGTKKSREYTHVFVPGDIYGGKIGSLLCKKSWREYHVHPGMEFLSDMCPQCRIKLEKLCKEIVGFPGRATSLFVEQDGKVPWITKEELLAAMTAVRNREYKDKNLPQQVAWVDMDKAKQPVRRTQPWTVPQPLSISGTTSR